VSRVWTVITVSKDNDLGVSECWTHVVDSVPAYKDVSEQVGTNKRVVAMIPGCHASGVKIFPLHGHARKETWVDPFDTPFTSIDE
jgi:hypothetical protein